jgi:hypothetical protein
MRLPLQGEGRRANCATGEVQNSNAGTPAQGKNGRLFMSHALNRLARQPEPR